jgi:predicted nucleic acid-binding protein
MSRRRFVFDTSALVSAALFVGSVPDRAFRRALELGDVLLSAETLAEATDVLRRPKFDRYVTVGVREEFLEALVERAASIQPALTSRPAWRRAPPGCELCVSPEDRKMGGQTRVTSESGSRLAGRGLRAS